MLAARPIAALATLAASIFACASAAQADQTYRVTGKDSFTIGARDLRGEVVYDGKQTLTIVRSDHATRFAAKVTYTKVDQGATMRARGEFLATMLPNGEQRDEANADPDYLTVLNQPFSVQLDQATIRDVAHLRGGVPFAFPSPMTGAALRGTLRHAEDGFMAGERVIGIAFEARGPMRGSLPEHPEIALNGAIRMSGTAYYTYRDSLLLALNATLTITGNLADRSPLAGSKADPVTIVYRRSIRPDEPSPSREARR